MSFPRQAPPSSTTILRTCLWRRAPESGSGVFSAISGLREPTDDPVGPVLRDDRDPADAPVRKAAPVGRQRMVAPNEVQDRGFEPCPQRRALGPRFEQGAVVFVAPLFIAVAIFLEGDRQVIGVTGIGTHDLPHWRAGRIRLVPQTSGERVRRRVLLHPVLWQPSRFDRRQSFTADPGRDQHNTTIAQPNATQRSASFSNLLNLSLIHIS